jgi:hypothetical protein
MLDKLKDFDVLFCYGDGLLSKAIKAVTQSDFSHAAHFRIINGKAFVVDAQKNGLTARPFEDWQKEFEYTFIVMREPNLTALTIENYAQREFDLLGTRYDFESLTIRQPRKIVIEALNKLRKKKKDSWNEKSDAKEVKRLYCSEHIATVRNFAEKQLTPKELLFECVQRGYKTIEI